MKSFILLLVVVGFGSCYGQDYLDSFSKLERIEVPMIVKKFDTLKIVQYGLVSEHLVVDLEVPAEESEYYKEVFSEVFSQENSRSGIVEIDYKVCFKKECAVRYKIKSPTGNWRDIKIASTSSSSSQSKGLVDVSYLARVFSLKQLLTLAGRLDDVVKKETFKELEQCRFEDMFGYADWNCIINLLKTKSTEEIQNLLTIINELE